MTCEIVESKRTWVTQQFAEQTASGRESSEPSDRLRFDAVVDEARQPDRLVLVHDAQRPIARIDESACSDDDALENSIKIEVLGDDKNRLKEPAEPRIHGLHGTSEGDSSADAPSAVLAA
jgi:hypothetical protein